MKLSKLEEDVMPLIDHNQDLAIQASIAISLKRIADRLDENTSHTYSEPAFRMRGDMA
jgi:hypothetical protein